MSRSRLFLEWLAILACALTLAWWATVGGLTARFDNALLDRLATASAHPAADDVLIVAIDDRSLAEAGRWPWDRAKMAQLLDRLTAARAKSVLLDVLYTEPSSAKSDQDLAQAMARARNVALPFGLTPAEGRTAGFDAVPIIPDLAEQVFATGHVAITPDADGTVRRLALSFTDTSGRTYRHLAAELFRETYGKTSQTYAGADSAPILQLRSSGSYRTISAAAVMRGEVQEQFIKSKVIIIGATAPGLGDLFPVSAAAGSIMSGAELQANLFQDITDNGFMSPVSRPFEIGISCALIVLLFIGFWRLRPSLCLVLAIGLAVAALVIAIALATGWKLWFPPGSALLALIAAYPLWGWRRLVVVSQFLESEAAKLEPAAGLTSTFTLGGFDTIAQQVSRLDYLVDEVAARRDFLRRVIESTPDALCAFDVTGRLVLMNGHAKSLFGAEVDGLNLPDMIVAMQGRYNADASELLLSDGRNFAVTHSGSLSQAALETIRIVQFTDITATRKAEQDRRHMLEFLSHDMRSPQVAILGLAGQQAHDDDEAARFARIRSHARRTMELADNFIQFARLGEVPLSLDELDLGMLADEARDRAWSGARDRQMKLTVTLPENPVFIRADGQVLSRVFDNLIGNAVRYGNEGGTVCITVERIAGGDKASLTVSDDGPGLPEDRKANPFRRYGPHGEGGTGLGLAFVSEAIARHGGAITCVSVAGKGTQFAICLPALADINDG